MKIQNYNLITNINKQTFKKNSASKENSYAEKQSNETKRQLTTALIATAITSAFIGGALAKKRLWSIDNKTINSLKNTISELTKENNEIKKSSNQLKRILDEKLMPNEIKSQYKTNLQKTLKEINKDYDMTNPQVLTLPIENPLATGLDDLYLNIDPAFKVSKPTPQEEQKIGIIRLAIKKLAPALRENQIKGGETKPFIYIFDNLAPENKDCNFIAEAIIENQKAEGFWIEKNYLNKTNFSDALETALHELCHKFGGDESKEFSYKLTDVNSSVLKQIHDDSETMLTLKALNEMWNEIN